MNARFAVLLTYFNSCVYLSSGGYNIELSVILPKIFEGGKHESVYYKIPAL